MEIKTLEHGAVEVKIDLANATDNEIKQIILLVASRQRSEVEILRLKSKKCFFTPVWLIKSFLSLNLRKLLLFMCFLGTQTEIPDISQSLLVCILNF